MLKFRNTLIAEKKELKELLKRQAVNMLTDSAGGFTMLLQLDFILMGRRDRR